jgi:integrase
MASIRKRKFGPDKDREAWVVDYLDQAGKRRLKTFATRKAADDWKTTALHEVREGIHTPASVSKTVEEAWDQWLADCEANNLEYGTILQRRQHLNHHVKPFIGRIKLSALTVPRANQFITELRDNGRSGAMRRKVLTNLKTMLTFAQKQGWVSQNVARTIRLKGDDRAAPGPLREGVDFPSRAELKAMMEAAPARWRPLLVTAMFTGMRASELRGLTWADVDFDSGTIHVRQRADAWKKIGNPKSKAGKRDIPLATIVVNTLRQWKGDNDEPKAPICPKGELGLVFPNGRGNVETLPNIYKRFWKPLQLACGLTVDSGRKDAEGETILDARYGFHMLRHAAASLFIAYLGWSPKRVQTVMGHSSINMTFDLYGHLFENKTADREAMERVEAAITAA